MTDDRDLVSGILNGDEQAHRRLIRQHQRLVSHMVGRLVKNQEDLEELCQDIFLKVFEKIGEFGFQSKLSTWIGTIAYHQAINHLRKRKLMVDGLGDDESWTNKFVEMQNPESMLSEKDVDAWVFKLVDTLPPQYKTVLMLYHKDEMNYSEIAQITGMPEGTVKNYLFRARTLLKEKLKPYLGATV